MAAEKKLDYLKKYLAKTGAANDKQRKAAVRRSVLAHAALDIDRIRLGKPAENPAPVARAGEAAQGNGRQRRLPQALQAEPRREGQDSDLDFSPPRKIPKHEALQAESGRQGQDSDLDLSPPRKIPKHEVLRPKTRERDDVKALQAESRRQGQDSDLDLSAPRKIPKHEAFQAQSGRQGQDSDLDLSPPRKIPKQEARRHDVGGPGQLEGAQRMSSGLAAGLVKAPEVRAEAVKTRAEKAAALEAARASGTEQQAPTLHRSATGALTGRDEWIREQLEIKNKSNARRRKAPENTQEIGWGKGLKQEANREEEQVEMQRVAAQPFARFEIDGQYDEELRHKRRNFDPIADFEDDEAEADNPTAAAVKQRPTCPHLPWPNRFNILPGYRWDGKVRGTGFQQRWFEAQNMRELKKRERWKWECVED